MGGRRVTQDGQIAVAVDKFEDFADRRLVHRARQADGPAEAALFRLKSVQGRHAAGVDLDRRVAQPRQFPQQEARVVGFGVQGAVGPEHDAPVAADRRLRPRRGRQVHGVELDRLEAELVLLRLGRGGGRGRRRVAVGQGLQLRDKPGRAPFIHRRAGAAGGGHMVVQHVRGAQQGLDGGVVAGFAARAQLVHQGLEDVGEAHQRLHAEGPGAALDRVHRAEHGVDGLVVAFAVLQRQQAGLQVGEKLLALLEEGRLDGLKGIFGHVVLPLRPQPGEPRPPA